MKKVLVLSTRDVKSNEGDSSWRDAQYQCGGDCACESGLNRRETSHHFSLKNLHPKSENLIPKLSTELFFTPIKGYWAAYNPKARYGVAVLNFAGCELLKTIDGKSDCNTLALKLGWELGEVMSGISKLEEAALIYTAPDEPSVDLLPSSTISVWMHVTNQCNLRCRYCYIAKTNQYMSVETGRKAIDEIVATGIQNQAKEIVFKFAGGEPLLSFPLVLELAQYARQQAKRAGINVQPVLLTNGTPIQADIARTLADNDFRVAISLDGLQEYNDTNRPTLGGQGSFRRIENGLNLLLAHKVACNVSVVVTKYNLENLPELTRYLLSKNLSFTFNFFRENTIAENTLSVDNNSLIEHLEQAYGVIAEQLPNYSIMNAILDRVQFNQPHLQACGVGSNYIVVTHEGKIAGCQMKIANPVARSGEGDLIKIIRERNFIDPHARTSENKEGCQSCQWRYTCAGGCPIITYTTFGRYDTRSPFCSVYKALIPQVLELEAQRILSYSSANLELVETSNLD